MTPAVTHAVTHAVTPAVPLAPTPPAHPDVVATGAGGPLVFPGAEGLPSGAAAVRAVAADVHLLHAALAARTAGRALRGTHEQDLLALSQAHGRALADVLAAVPGAVLASACGRTAAHFRPLDEAGVADALRRRHRPVLDHTLLVPHTQGGYLRTSLVVAFGAGGHWEQQTSAPYAAHPADTAGSALARSTGYRRDVQHWTAAMNAWVAADRWRPGDDELEALWSRWLRA
ncbi:hypothetical protein [Cellulomonas marina]|uniref:Uncharacterized protein n=1 Tax=Cellulomonas marina TaxID=988821 RepID=A0A1I1AIP9_9CELL|nr:hypothetical protein [Cellulomonas marina]GIG30784.1 hypothetical protein Cma02nite_33840 [Cellulomonas marina]SFB37372.1 hypothetical protein SAMN05421867_11854 [Cellulomonas marina]